MATPVIMELKAPRSKSKEFCPDPPIPFGTKRPILPDAGSQGSWWLLGEFQSGRRLQPKRESLVQSRIPSSIWSLSHDGEWWGKDLALSSHSGMTLSVTSLRSSPENLLRSLRSFYCYSASPFDQSHVSHPSQCSWKHYFIKLLHANTKTIPPTTFVEQFYCEYVTGLQGYWSSQPLEKLGGSSVSLCPPVGGFGHK